MPFESLSSLRRGFTLLELIVVIFVLSLVLAVSLPTFVERGGGRMQSDAKRIASIVRYLNDSALSMKEDFSMKISLRDKTILYSGPEGEKSERFETLSSVALQSKGQISEGEVIIPFGSLGAAESLQFNLRDEGRGAAVSLNALSGKVKIENNEES